MARKGLRNTNRRSKKLAKLVKKGLITAMKTNGETAVQNDILAILDDMRGASVLVAGDIMLDRFVYGAVDRISPEGPIPVLAVAREDFMPGGAGNVFINLCALGARAHVFSITGDDDAAKTLRALGDDAGADMAGVLIDSSRPTTIKTRFIARGQQLLRSDVEKTHALSDALSDALFQNIQNALPRMKAVVLSDYGKGVLTDALIAKIIAAAAKAGIPVLVDPKGRNYTKYRGASLVTPNRKELAEASGAQTLKTDAEIELAASHIIEFCGIGAVIATRSEDGLSVIASNAQPLHVRAQAREVFDVSGAGDTVIATLAAVLATGAGLADAALIANIAAGIAVGKIGTTPVSAEELRSKAQTGFASGNEAEKIMDEQSAVARIKKWQAQGLKVGFTNGCFDIVHAGHVRYLAQAKSQCDRLVVALNRDSSVKILKGPERPVNHETARAAVIAALGCVDGVVFFGAAAAGDNNTPAIILDHLRPDIFFKGGDYSEDQLPEAVIVRAYGGDVRLMALHNGYSTTNIIAKTRKGT